MKSYTDYLIVGGGISGLLTARELRATGQSVTVIDRSSPGKESSWAGGGILLPIYPWRQDEAISDLVSASLEMYPALSRELLDATGIDPEWRACGMLICNNPDIDRAKHWCEMRNVRFYQPPPSIVEGVNCELQNPLWLPDIAQARNPRLIKSLTAYLKQRGVGFIEHAGIDGIELSGKRIANLRIGGQAVSAGQFVLCTGAWTGGLLKTWLPASKITPQIEPVRGQMLLFDALPGTLRHMVLDGDRYLIPRSDGKILAGSTVEQVGFDKQTTTEARRQLHDFATRLYPALTAFPVTHHWAGLRPGTPRGVPYIGRHPEIENLSVNAGHFRNGLVMGPASARLLSDLLLNRPSAVDPAPYRLDRPLA